MTEPTSDSSPGASTPQVDLTGIDPVFHDVVRKYGRSMFALVLNAGMAREASNVLGTLVQKHASRHSAHALGVLAQAFNQVSNAYIVQCGWDEGTLAQCDRDIQLAFAGKIQVVPGNGGLVLNS